MTRLWNIDLFSNYFDPWLDTWTNHPGGILKRVAYSPTTNIETTPEYVMISVVAPGLKKEDFQLEVSDSNLEISAALKSKVESLEYIQEEFKRSYRLENCRIDDAEATYEQGILKIKIPRILQKATSTKKIVVK
jgi:HSP20 family protein